MKAVAVVSNIINNLEKATRFSLFQQLHNYYEITGHKQQLKPITKAIYQQPLKRLPEMNLAQAALYQIEPDDFAFHANFFTDLPDYFAGYFVNRYKKIHAEKGRRDANTYLRKTLSTQVLPRVNRVSEQYKIDSVIPGILPFPYLEDFSKLPNFERDKVKDLSFKLSNYMQESFFQFTNQYKRREGETERQAVLAVYRYTSRLLGPLNIPIPYMQQYKKDLITENQILAACARMTSPSWLYNQIQRRRNFQREHLAIAVGQVQKLASPYASQTTVNEWLEQKRRNTEFFKNFELENEDGERVPLSEMVYKSCANPAIRRCELMVRMRGFEDLANKMGCVGVFYTITAPSRFHSVYSTGGFIDNWNANTPRDTQKYLCNIWAKARATLKRCSLNVFGFRVAEPHHDGTPHWHLLLFMRPEHEKSITEILQKYAKETDADELKTDKAHKARFDVERIDPSKGSATGYIAKYISKNIDGYALDDEIDDDTGQKLKDMARNVTAWASRWRIRQFQQIGGAPVTVWRELRRLESGLQLDDQKMDAVLEAADMGDWAAYTEAQGGALVSRKDLIVRLNYEIEKESNCYNEDIKRIRGIFSPLLGEKSEVKTRLIKWRIVPKGNNSEADAVSRNGGNAAPWSSVNNCTGVKNEDQRRKISILLKSRGIAPGPEDIDHLLNGSIVNFGYGIEVKYRNGQLLDIDNVFLLKKL